MDDDPTPAQTEGPYFTSNSPLRTSLSGPARPARCCSQRVRQFSLQTIVPGLYPGRTRHIHVKVQAPNGRVLTSQLYFPGEARNASDGIYSAELLLAVQDAGAARAATFNFVLA